VGIFHELLDYPGVPEERTEISRGFLKSLPLDLILMGHYHVAYSEPRLFNPGSPEYWAFDQAEQITYNVDTEEETMRPAKKKGFYLIDTNRGNGEFVTIEPARSMFCITYETDRFDERVHLPTIKEHLAKYNKEGTMVKSILRGRHLFGKLNLSKNLFLDKPLIHTTVTNLIPASVLPDKRDTIDVQTDYLVERGIEKTKARELARWFEQHKERIAEMQGGELLRALRSVLENKD
jgi:hypothetical protein